MMSYEAWNVKCLGCGTKSTTTKDRPFMCRECRKIIVSPCIVGLVGVSPEYKQETEPAEEIGDPLYNYVNW